MEKVYGPMPSMGESLCGRDLTLLSSLFTWDLIRKKPPPFRRIFANSRSGDIFLKPFFGDLGEGAVFAHLVQCFVDFLE